MKNVTLTFILARTESSYNDIHQFGVYKIYHIDKPTIPYIGSATSDRKWRKGFRERWKGHIKELRANIHCSKFLQRVVNKYGIEGLRFEIIEKCPSDICLEREQYWLDFYKPFGRHGYNTCKIAGSSLGYKYSEDQIKNRKKVYQYDLKGNFINEFKSLTYAAKQTNSRINDIKQCCKKRIAYTNGHIWRYEKEKVDSVFHIKIFKMACYFNGEFQFVESLQKVEELTKVNKSIIYDCINKNSNKTINGWLFRKYDSENCPDNIKSVMISRYKYEVIENEVSIIFDTVLELTSYLNVHRKYFEKRMKLINEIIFNNKTIKKLEK